MAEEKSDGLEGLEDFDDDFGEQLDSFMDKDGEEESDSELDSFFEDLSTIDDLDGEEESNSKPENSEESSDEKIKIDTPKSETKKEINLEDALDTDEDEIIEEKSNKKGFPVKAVIFSSLTGIFLGIITLLIMFFFPSSSEKRIPEVVLKKTIQKKPVAKIIKPKIKQKYIKKKKKISKKIINKYSYDIQVASCISKECLDDSRIILNSLGYKTRIRNSIEKSGIAEVLSSNILSEEKSVNFTNKINNKNPLAGYAFSKPAKNGYHISLGYFPNLETANRVRTYLNQAFKEDIFFEIKRTSQKINFQVVEVSGLKSKEEADMLLSTLKKKNPNFESAFIKSITKK